MKKTALFLVMSLLLVACQKKVEVQKNPNIVYILADDMGQGDLTCYNSESKIKTPAMDGLAAHGMMFTDFHSNSAVCTPTRYGTLTGRYSFRTRLKKGVLWSESKSLIEKGEPTVASLVKKYGYNTACIGKWHLGINWQMKAKEEIKPKKKGEKRRKIGGSNIDFTKPITLGPTDLGFDYFYGIAASLDIPPYVYVENNRVTEAVKDTMFSPWNIDPEKGGRWGYASANFNLEEVLPTFTEKAIAFIDKQSDDKPFFLYFPLNAPHTPIVPTKQFLGKSGAGLYGDFVMEVDWVVERIVKVLKEKGLYDNTIIVLTSDNGCSPHGFPIELEKKYNHNTSNNYKGRKSHSYEGGHRVPCIVSWPGKIKQGTKSDEIICSTDLYATLADILNHKMKSNEGVDSYSILPVLMGEDLQKPLREATIHHSLNGMFSIRKGKWKYIDGKGHGGFHEIKEEFSKEPVQLYNMETDPYETTNVYKEHPEVVKELKTLLETYKKQGYSRPM